jgi:hypothetical protein
VNFADPTAISGTSADQQLCCKARPHRHPRARRPVEERRKAWTEPAYVMRWWGPTGFTCPRAEMDVRVGSRSLVCMRALAEYGGGDKGQSHPDLAT